MGAIQIISDNEVLPESVDRTVASIGVFDGVHKGHQRLLDLVKGKSISDAIPSVVITFDQHPTEVTSPENAPKVLTPLSKKILLLDELGIDYVYVLTFNESRASTPAVKFINEIFVKAVRAKAFILMFGTDIEEIRGKGVKGGTLTDIESISKMNLSQDELREQIIAWVSQMIAFYNGQSPTRS